MPTALPWGYPTDRPRTMGAPSTIACCRFACTLPVGVLCFVSELATYLVGTWPPVIVITLCVLFAACMLCTVITLNPLLVCIIRNIRSYIVCTVQCTHVLSYLLIVECKISLRHPRHGDRNRAKEERVTAQSPCFNIITTNKCVWLQGWLFGL